MRSLLFVPADSERKFEKACQSGADALILDLEDSVALASKQAARATAARSIAGHDGGALIFVRVNDLSTGLTDDDLAAVMEARPHGIMLPKAGGIDDVARLSVRLRVLEARHGIADGSTRILPIITETPAAVLNMQGHARGDERLAGLTWGAEDLSAEIGAADTRNGSGQYTDVFRFARLGTILAAAAANVAAIDTVYPDFRDIDGFRRDCFEGARDGFTGRMAIHPAQVPVINEVFTPSAEAVAEAQAIVAAFATAGDVGVVGIEGRMLDRPHLKRAERLLARTKPGQA